MTHETYPLCSQLAFKNAEGNIEVYEIHDESALHEIPSEYVTENELNNALNNYYTIANIDELLNNYYDKEYIDILISNYYTSNEVDNLLGHISCDLVETYAEETRRLTLTNQINL